MVNQAHGIPASRLEEFVRKSALFSNVFQTPVVHDNNKILNSILVPPNKYLFSHKIAHKNQNMRRISFWNYRGWRSGQGATEIFLFESGTDILGVCETFLDENSANKINIGDFQFFHVGRNKDKARWFSNTS